MRSGVSCAVVAGLLAAGGVARADVTLNFFGDIDYVVEHEPHSPTTNTFQAAELDIFASQTEGKFSFIGEVIVEALGENEFSSDIDRLEVSYKPTPWLRFRAGRLRSSIGYYGDAYQNGKYFMTPVSWPEMYEGNGADGILPSHSIGVHGDAAYALGEGNGKLTLDLEVLNGRGAGLDDVPVWQDSNNSKAVNVRVRYVGDGALEGLVVGGNAYVDDIPEDVLEGELPEDAHPAMHELMLGAHAAYVADKIHLVSEFAWFRHRVHGEDLIFQSVAVFGEAAYQFGDVIPYSRLEYFHYDGDDPYFMASGIEMEDAVMLSAGVKYAASSSVAVKLEAGNDFARNHRHLLAQAAFAF